MNKYYNINKLKEINKPIKIVTIKPVLTQLKEMLIGKHLINSTSLKVGISRYGIIVDLDKTKVVVKEEANSGTHFWFVPYNSKDWLLCD